MDEEKAQQFRPLIAYLPSRRSQPPAGNASSTLVYVCKSYDTWISSSAAYAGRFAMEAEDALLLGCLETGKLAAS